MSESHEIKGIFPQAYNFYMDKLGKIYDAWDDGDLGLALIRACRLVVFFPPKIKKEIVEEKDRIQMEFKRIAAVKGHDFHTTITAQKRMVYALADRELESFVDRMTSLMDQEGLLTLTFGASPRSKLRPHIGAT